MLTETEMKISLWYWKYFSKTYTIHFIWKDGRMSLKRSSHGLYNIFMWTLAITVLWCKITVFRSKLKNNDINGAILQSIFILITMGGTLIQGILFLNRDRLVQLTNELVHCNSVWGKPLQLMYNWTKKYLGTRMRIYLIVLSVDGSSRC